MADNSDIRAGKAFIEVGVKGIDQAAQLLTSFGQRLKGLAANVWGKAEAPEWLAQIFKFARSPAGLFTAFSAMAKSWAESGHELFTLAQRTNMGVEALSLLKFASEECGVSFEELVPAISRMQRMLFQLSQSGGSNRLRTELKQLGVDVKDLKLMSAEEQFFALMDAISRVHNPVEQAGLAMQIFGRSAASLLPLLRQGKEGFAALRKEAEELGLIRSEKSVLAAQALWKALENVSRMSRSVSSVIGEAVAPVLERMADVMAGSLRGIRDWLKAHQEWIATVFKGASILTGFGAALFAVGQLFDMLGHVLGPLAGTLRAILGALPAIASAIGTAILGTMNILVAVFSAGAGVLATLATTLLNPWNLLAAALIAMAFWATGAFSAISQVVTMLGNKLEWVWVKMKGLASTLMYLATTASEAVGNALAGGRIDLAWNVVVTGAQAAFARILLFAASMWAQFKATAVEVAQTTAEVFIDTWFGSLKTIADGMINVFVWVVDAIKQMFYKLANSMIAALERAINSIKFAVAALIRSLPAALGGDPNHHAEHTHLDRLPTPGKEDTENQIGKPARKAIDDALDGTRDDWKKGLAKHIWDPLKKSLEGDGEGKAFDEWNKARAAFDKAVDEANAVAPVKKAPELNRTPPGDTQFHEENHSTKGTFNAFGVFGLAGSDKLAQIENNTRQTVAELQRQGRGRGAAADGLPGMGVNAANLGVIGPVGA